MESILFYIYIISFKNYFSFSPIFLIIYIVWNIFSSRKGIKDKLLKC